MKHHDINAVLLQYLVGMEKSPERRNPHVKAEDNSVEPGGDDRAAETERCHEVRWIENLFDLAVVSLPYHFLLMLWEDVDQPVRGARDLREDLVHGNASGVAGGRKDEAKRLLVFSYHRTSNGSDSDPMHLGQW